MTSSPPPITSYTQAAAYLAAGRRSTVNRPHGNARRIVADFVAPGTISMVYHRTPVMTWLPDGRSVAWFAEHMTKTTLAHIESYVGISAQWGYVDGVRTMLRPALANLAFTGRTRTGGGDGYALSVSTPSWPRTASNVKRCRSCKGTGRRSYDWSDGERDCYNCAGPSGSPGMKEWGNGLIPDLDDGSRPIVFGDGDARITSWGDLGLEVPSRYACTCKLCTSGASTWQEYNAQQSYWAKEGGNVFGVPAPAAVGYGDSGTLLASILPGLDTHSHCPQADCCETGSISNLIIHLNDKHRLSRPQIADWLDQLDADLTFPAHVS